MRPIVTNRVALFVGLSVCHTSESYKNGRTDRDGHLGWGLGGPTEPCIRWRSRSPMGRAILSGREGRSPWLADKTEMLSVRGRMTAKNMFLQRWILLYIFAFSVLRIQRKRSWLYFWYHSPLQLSIFALMYIILYWKFLCYLILGSVLTTKSFFCGY